METMGIEPTTPFLQSRSEAVQVVPERDVECRAWLASAQRTCPSPRKTAFLLLKVAKPSQLPDETWRRSDPHPGTRTANTAHRILRLPLPLGTRQAGWTTWLPDPTTRSSACPSTRGWRWSTRSDRASARTPTYRSTSGPALRCNDVSISTETTPTPLTTSTSSSPGFGRRIDAPGPGLGQGHAEALGRRPDRLRLREALPTKLLEHGVPETELGEHIPQTGQVVRGHALGRLRDVPEVDDRRHRHDDAIAGFSGRQRGSRVIR